MSPKPYANATIGVLISSLADLRSAFTSQPGDDDIQFTPSRTISLPVQPNIIQFASDGTRLLVGLTSGATAVYDTSVITSQASTIAQPLHVFPSPTGRPPLDISANPGDLPEIVAVLYESNGSPDSVLVELLDVQKLQVIGGWKSGEVPETTPSAGEELRMCT